MRRNHLELVSRSTACDHVLDIRAEALDARATESVAVDSVSRRTLAEDVTATTDKPPGSHTTMDGFAFDAAVDYALEIVDRDVFPEDEPGSLGPLQAVEIATSAPLHTDANAVLKREETSVDNCCLEGPPLTPGTSVYERGSNVDPGGTVRVVPYPVAG